MCHNQLSKKGVLATRDMREMGSDSRAVTHCKAVGFGRGQEYARMPSNAELYCRILLLCVSLFLPISIF